MSTADTVEDTANEVPPRTLLVCGACGEPGPPKTCSGCKMEFYCDNDQKCQKDHRKEHRSVCNRTKKFLVEHENIIEQAKQMLRDKKQHDTTTCSICLEENTNHSASFVKLDCGHFFCFDECIHKCQEKRMRDRIFDYGSCPLCRQPLPNLKDLLKERNRSFLYLAKNASTEEERNEICRVALDEVESVLKQFPVYGAARQMLGDINMVIHQYEGAIEAFTTMFHCYLRAENCSSIDEVYSALDMNPMEVPVDLDTSYSGPLTEPGSIIWHYNTLAQLSLACIRNGEPQYALKLLDLCAELSETHRLVVDNNCDVQAYAVAVVECFYELGDYDKALKNAERWLDPKQPKLQTPLSLMRARCFLALDEFQKAKCVITELFYCVLPFDGDMKRECLKLWKEINAAEAGE